MFTFHRHRRSPAALKRLRRRFDFTLLLAAFALGVTAAIAPGGAAAVTGEASGSSECRLPQGILSPRDLPAGSSVVECDAVGRVISVDGVALTIPEPGLGVSMNGLAARGGPQHFQLEVSGDGVISYPETSSPGHGEESDAPSPAADPSACNDKAYTLLSWSAYPSYEWHIGDGAMPGALSRTAAQKAFKDAINNITGSYNNCGLADEVSVGHTYKGTTTYESDFTADGGGCAERDKVGTWDAGNMPSRTVAAACIWYFSGGGSMGQVVESDVRFNTDHEFTNNPNGACVDKFDIRAIGTHEAGHIYGLDHVGDGHSNLTMHTYSFSCSTKARTLGKGDVLGLRKRY